MKKSQKDVGKFHQKSSLKMKLILLLILPLTVHSGLPHCSHYSTSSSKNTHCTKGHSKNSENWLGDHYNAHLLSPAGIVQRPPGTLSPKVALNTINCVFSSVRFLFTHIQKISRVVSKMSNWRNFSQILCLVSFVLDYEFLTPFSLS